MVNGFADGRDCFASLATTTEAIVNSIPSRQQRMNVLTFTDPNKKGGGKPLPYKEAEYMYQAILL